MENILLGIFKTVVLTYSKDEIEHDVINTIYKNDRYLLSSDTITVGIEYTLKNTSGYELTEGEIVNTELANNFKVVYQRIDKTVLAQDELVKCTISFSFNANKSLVGSAFITRIRFNCNGTYRYYIINVKFVS